MQTCHTFFSGSMMFFLQLHFLVITFAQGYLSRNFLNNFSKRIRLWTWVQIVRDVLTLSRYFQSKTGTPDCRIYLARRTSCRFFCIPLWNLTLRLTHRASHWSILTYSSYILNSYFLLFIHHFATQRHPVLCSCWEQLLVSPVSTLETL